MRACSKCGESKDESQFSSNGAGKYKSHCKACRAEAQNARYHAGLVKPQAKPSAERFWERIAKSDGCWIWTGHVRKDGYGRWGEFAAYNLAYEFTRGPIPDGLELDHLCRNRACVRPDHLEPVTHRENVLRGNGACARYAKQTHCKRGHAFDAENTRIDKIGRRWCRACGRWHNRQRRASLRVA